MTSSAITALILWGGLALQAGIAAAMIWRRLYRTLPIFFSYTVFLVLRTIALFYLRRMGAWPYFYGYWGSEVLTWALGLAVIQEAMQHLLAPYSAVQRLVLVLFRWGAGLLIAIALFTAYVAPGSDLEHLLANILVFERSVRIVQLGLLSLLFVFAGFLRLRWPHYVFGIALGFGVFCSVELVAVTMRTNDIWSHSVFLILKPLAFVVAQTLWLYYIAVPERSPQDASERLPVPQMEGWDSALSALLRQ